MAASPGFCFHLFKKKKVTSPPKPIPHSQGQKAASVRLGSSPLGISGQAQLEPPALTRRGFQLAVRLGDVSTWTPRGLGAPPSSQERECSVLLGSEEWSQTPDMSPDSPTSRMAEKLLHQ